MRILVVDGAPRRDWLAEHLGALGNVITAATVHAARRLVAGQPWDYVLIGDVREAEQFGRELREAPEPSAAGVPRPVCIGIDSRPVLDENLGLEHYSTEEKRAVVAAFVRRRSRVSSVAEEAGDLQQQLVEMRRRDEEVCRANRRLSTLLEETRRMLSPDDEEAALAELLRTASQLGGGVPAALIVARKEGLVVRQVHGIPGERIGSDPLGERPRRRIAPFERLLEPPELDDALCRLFDTDRYYVIPLRHEARAQALIALGGDPAEADRGGLQLLAPLAAMNLRLRRRMRQLRTQADQDGLTRLKNHAAVKRQLRLEVKRHQRLGRPLSVILFDLDHFKRVNDTHGHLAGDKVLCTVAEMLRRSSRETDTIGRYGGEEFVMLLPDTGRAGAEQKVLTLLASLREVQLSGTGPLTFSAGIAEFPRDGQTPTELFASADAALYAAKRAGRDQVVTYTEWLEEEFRRGDSLFPADRFAGSESTGDHP